MVSKHLQAKRKHHHVYADYLTRWSENGRDLYYTTAKGKIVCESVRGVAMKQDFYKLSILSDQQVEIIKSFLKNSPRDQQEILMSFLQPILMVQHVHQLLQRQGKCDAQVEAIIHTHRCNTLEDFHQKIENKARPVLEALVKRDFSILSNAKDMCSFIMFVGNQFTRTNNFKEIAIARLSRKTEQENIVADAMVQAWWFFSLIFGMNMGRSLYLGRKLAHHCLLINETSVPFITSDQPVINVHSCLGTCAPDVPPEFLDLYYPISPNVAYCHNDSQRFKDGVSDVDEGLVDELNLKMARRANTHIFGSTKEVLKPLLKHVNDKI